MNPEELFASLEKKYELPSGYLARTYQIESGGGRNLYNRQSGAAGPFQFIPSTARAYNLKDPYDLSASADAAARLAAANRADLRAAGVEDPTAAQLYLAHQQGARGAAKLLTGGETPAAQLVGRNAVLWNAGQEGMTGPQFAQMAMAKYEGAKPAYSAPTGQPGPAAGGTAGAAEEAKTTDAAKSDFEQYREKQFFNNLISSGLSMMAQQQPRPMQMLQPVMNRPRVRREDFLSGLLG
jgi:hypothetical protein